MVNGDIVFFSICRYLSGENKFTGSRKSLIVDIYSRGLIIIFNYYKLWYDSLIVFLKQLIDVLVFSFQQKHVYNSCCFITRHCQFQSCIGIMPSL
jgi:hypothetical protein